jgi:hypothetical protein
VDLPGLCGSEFKTDLDIERLPSGKSDTNDLVLAFAVWAYNLLHFIGLIGLTRGLPPFAIRPSAGGSGPSSRS